MSSWMARDPGKVTLDTARPRSLVVLLRRRSRSLQWFQDPICPARAALQRRCQSGAGTSVLRLDSNQDEFDVHRLVNLSSSAMDAQLELTIPPGQRRGALRLDLLPVRWK
jgi:hypothetical protein